MAHLSFLSDSSLCSTLWLVGIKLFLALDRSSMFSLAPDPWMALHISLPPVWSHLGHSVPSEAMSGARVVFVIRSPQCSLTARWVMPVPSSRVSCFLTGTPLWPSCVLRAKHAAWHCEILYGEMTVLCWVTGSHAADSRNVEFILALRLRL